MTEWQQSALEGPKAGSLGGQFQYFQRKSHHAVGLDSAICVSFLAISTGLTQRYNAEARTAGKADWASRSLGQQVLHYWQQDQQNNLA